MEVLVTCICKYWKLADNAKSVLHQKTYVVSPIWLSDRREKKNKTTWSAHPGVLLSHKIALSMFD